MFIKASLYLFAGITCLSCGLYYMVQLMAEHCIQRKKKVKINMDLPAVHLPGSEELSTKETFPSCVSPYKPE